jgi:hypothetical protein
LLVARVHARWPSIEWRRLLFQEQEALLVAENARLRVRAEESRTALAAERLAVQVRDLWEPLSWSLGAAKLVAGSR